MHLEATLAFISTPVTPNQALHVSVLISAVSHQNTDIKTLRKGFIVNSVSGSFSDLVV